MGFDIDGARKAGYSDDQIADYLAGQKGIDVGAARKAGYTTDRLMVELSDAFVDRTPSPEQPKPAAQSTGLSSVRRSGTRAEAKPYVAPDPLVTPDPLSNPAPAEQRQPLIEQRGAPVSDELVKTTVAQLSAMPRAQRQAQAKRTDLPGWMQETVRRAVEQIDGADAGAQRVGMTGPSLEARTARLMRDGADEATATAKATTDAQRGAETTGLPQMTAGQGLLTGEEQTANRAEGLKMGSKSLAERGLYGAREGLIQGTTGLIAMGLRAAGDEEAAKLYEKVGQGAAVRAQAANELALMQEKARDAGILPSGPLLGVADYADRMGTGAANSIGQMIPGIAAGLATGNAGVGLAMMALPVFGQSYIDKRDAGGSPGMSAAYGGAMAALEIIGERYGLMPAALNAFRKEAAKKPIEEVPAFIERGIQAMEKRGLFSKPVAAIVRGQAGEQFGEQITGAGQYLLDGTAFGLDKPISLSGFLENARDTAVQTLLATGVMQAGGGAAKRLMSGPRHAEDANATDRPAGAPMPQPIPRRVEPTMGDAPTPAATSAQAPASAVQNPEQAAAHAATAPAAQAVDNITGILQQAGALSQQPVGEDFTGLDEAPQAAAPTEPAAPVEGEKINRNWSAFAPESGTLGVPRADMPQIGSEHRGAFINFLAGRGIERTTEEVPADSLKPTQAEFSPKKVAQARERTGGDRSILVSADGYVIDGHHQWMAAREDGQPVKVIRLGAPVNDLLRLAHQFPSSYTAPGPKRTTTETTEQANAAGTDVGGNESRGPADGSAGAGVGSVVQGEQPATGSDGLAPGTGSGDVERAGAVRTGPGRGNDALTPGAKFTLDGKTWTVQEVKDSAVALVDADGKPRMVARNGKTFAKIMEALTGATDQPSTQGAKADEVKESISNSVQEAGALTPADQHAAPKPQHFKTRDGASKAAKESGNTMKVQKVADGFILRAKTDKELAAEQANAQRLARGKSVNPDSDSLLTAIAKLGGLDMSERADTIGTGNRNFGGKMLFRNGGQSIDTLANEALNELGYIPPDEHASDGGVRWLRDAIAAEFMGTRTHHSQRGESWMEQAQAEAESRAADQAAAQAEREADPDYDPFSDPYHAALSDFTVDDLAAEDYTGASPEVQAVTERLLAEAAAAGKDVEAIIERVAQTTEGATDHDYQTALQAELTEVLTGDAGRVQGPDARAAEAGDQDHSRAAGAQGRQEGGTEGLTLQAQTTEDLKAKADREDAATRAEKAKRDAEQARLKKEADERDTRARADQTVDDFQLGQSAEQQMSGMGDLFAEPAPAAAPAERYEAGRALTKEQRKQVLGTLVDVYKAKGAPREMKGQGRDGNERYGYVHSPELFEKSDITGAMVRYYVTLPDGRRAHPTELFPDYTQADIDAEMSARESRKRDRQADVLRATVPAQQFSTVREAVDWWDKRSRESTRTASGLPTIFPSEERRPLTDGAKFIMVPNNTSGELLEAFADAGWTPARAQPAQFTREQEGQQANPNPAEQTFDQWARAKYDSNEYRSSYLEAFGGNEKRAILGAAIGTISDDRKTADLLKEARAKYHGELLNLPRETSISLEVWDALDNFAKLEAQRHFYDLDRRLTRRTQDETRARVEAEKAKKAPYEAALAEVDAEIRRLDANTGPETQKQRDLSGRRERLREALYQIGQGKEPDGRLLRKAPEQPEATPAEPAQAATAILDAANVTGKERLDALKDVKAGTVTPEELAAAYPAKEEAKPKAEEQAAPAEAERPIDQPAEVGNFGEQLPPARRNMAAKLTEDLSDGDIASKPLSEIWPLAENEAIEDTFAAAVAHAARSEIPAKPRVAYKVKTWVQKVKMLRDLAGKIVSGTVTRERMAEKIQTEFRSLADWWSKVLLLEGISRDQWKRIGDVQERPDSYTYDEAGKQIPTPMLRVQVDDKTHWLRGDSGVEGAARGTLEGNRAGIMALLASAAPQQRMEFDVRQRRKDGTVFINKKGDGQYRPLMEFASVKEAREAITAQYDALVAAWEAVKARDNITERDLRSAENRPRAGKNHRNGRDVTPQEFQDQFGFRGGEFGKWVQQGKGDRERQAILNDAYDALMDLSDLLAIPPRAISLNGTLGIAFGSRGSGWASAHFEPSNLVINLTKTRGAGALGHEWFHALDNYFSRIRRGGAEAPFTGSQSGYRSENYITHRPEPMMIQKHQPSTPITRGRLEGLHAANPKSAYYNPENWKPDPKHPAGVRPEVEERFAALVQALDKSPMSQRARTLDGIKESGDGYWSRTLERAARAFENYLQGKMQDQGYHNDFLANVVAAEDTGRNPDRYPYLLPSELKPISEAFDALFSEVKTREDDAGNVAMFSRRGTNGRGISIVDAEAIAADIRATMPSAPQIVVVESVGQLPDKLRRLIEQAGADSDVEGVYWGGKVYAVSEHFTDLDRFRFVVAHHELRHHGLGAMLGPKLHRIMMQVYSTNAKVRELADKNIRDGLTVDVVVATEEALADMPVEELVKLNYWASLKAAIRDFMRRLSLKWEKKHPKLADMLRPEAWTDEDIARLISKAENVSRSGEPDYIRGGAVFAKAWHGTPHRGIEKFSTDKIGTGEGAQAYGWGLYFASKREVADFYRRNLTDANGGEASMDYNGLINGRRNTISQVADAYQELIDRDTAALEKETDPVWRKRLEGSIAATKEKLAKFERQGQLYEVNVPEDDELLHWGKTMDEQPASVLAALYASQWKESAFRRDGTPRNLKGEDLYRAIGEELGKGIQEDDGDGPRGWGSVVQTINDHASDERAASLALAGIGIKGIQYIDKTTRGAGEGSKNYVIFSGDDVQIERAMFSRARPKHDQATTDTLAATPGDLTATQSAAVMGGPANVPPSTWRDSLGRARFAPGQALFDLIGRGATPLLVKLSMKAASPELKRQLRAMRLEVQKAQDVALAVAQQANELSAEERSMVSDIIEKEMASETVPPEHAVRLASVMNQAMANQTTELVRLGMLSQEVADRWNGKYLPRFYESKLGDKAKDAWNEAIRALRGKPKTMQGIKAKHLKGRGLYETIPADSLAEYEALGWEVRDDGYIPGETAEVQVWRDYTREERDGMGEIRDAAFRFVTGYMQTQRDIALGRMFEAMANDETMSSRTARDGWVRVPDTSVEGTNAKRYGKLAGRFVAPEVLSHLSSVEEAQSDALQLYRKALAWWKQGKTALNPVSHANNILSNLSMAHFAGVSYWDAHKYVGALQDFITQAPGIKEARDAGLFLSTLSEAELAEALPPDLRELAMKADSQAKRNAKLVLEGLTSWFLTRPLGTAYNAEDLFFRYLIWRDARAQGMGADDAVEYAQRYIFTYDDMPKGMRMVRDFAIPFVSYTYKAVPALLHTALVYPWRMAAPAAVMWTANAMAYAIFAGGDDDDSWWSAIQKYLNDPEHRQRVREAEKTEREFLPQWMKGSTALLTPKAIRLGIDEVTNLPLFIDVSRIIPGGDLFDVSPNAGGLPIPQPLTPSHPLFTIATAMIANRDLWTGKDLVDSNDTRGEATAKRADWMWKQVSPAIAAGNYHWERIMQALTHANGGPVQWLPDAVADNYTGIGRDGLPVQPKLAALQTFGIKVRPVDLEKSQSMEEGRRLKLIRDIDAEVRALDRLAGQGSISDRAYERKIDQALEKRQNLSEGLTVDGDATN